MDWFSNPRYTWRHDCVFKSRPIFSDWCKSVVFTSLQNIASLRAGCYSIHRPRQTSCRMHLHEYKIFYTKWKQREVWMKITYKLLNTLVFWKGPPHQRTKMLQIPPFEAGVVWIGDRGKEQGSPASKEWFERFLESSDFLFLCYSGTCWTPIIRCLTHVNRYKNTRAWATRNYTGNKRERPLRVL